MTHMAARQPPDAAPAQDRLPRPAGQPTAQDSLSHQQQRDSAGPVKSVSSTGRSSTPKPSAKACQAAIHTCLDLYQHRLLQELEDLVQQTAASTAAGAAAGAALGAGAAVAAAHQALSGKLARSPRLLSPCDSGHASRATVLQEFCRQPGAVCAGELQQLHVEGQLQAAEAKLQVHRAAATSAKLKIQQLEQHVQQLQLFQQQQQDLLMQQQQRMQDQHEQLRAQVQELQLERRALLQQQELAQQQHQELEQKEQQLTHTEALLQELRSQVQHMELQQWQQLSAYTSLDEQDLRQQQLQLQRDREDLKQGRQQLEQQQQQLSLREQHVQQQHEALREQQEQLGKQQQQLEQQQCKLQQQQQQLTAQQHLPKPSTLQDTHSQVQLSCGLAVASTLSCQTSSQQQQQPEADLPTLQLAQGAVQAMQLHEACTLHVTAPDSCAGQGGLLQQVVQTLEAPPQNNHAVQLGLDEQHQLQQVQQPVLEAAAAVTSQQQVEFLQHLAAFLKALVADNTVLSCEVLHLQQLLVRQRRAATSSCEAVARSLAAEAVHLAWQLQQAEMQRELQQAAFDAAVQARVGGRRSSGSNGGSRSGGGGSNGGSGSSGGGGSSSSASVGGKGPGALLLAGELLDQVEVICSAVHSRLSGLLSKHQHRMQAMLECLDEEVEACCAECEGVSDDRDLQQELATFQQVYESLLCDGGAPVERQQPHAASSAAGVPAAAATALAADESLSSVCPGGAALCTPPSAKPYVTSPSGHVSLLPSRRASALQPPLITAAPAASTPSSGGSSSAAFSSTSGAAALIRRRSRLADAFTELSVGSPVACVPVPPQAVVCCSADAAAPGSGCASAAAAVTATTAPVTALMAAAGQPEACTATLLSLLGSTHGSPVCLAGACQQGHSPAAPTGASVEADQGLQLKTRTGCVGGPAVNPEAALQPVLQEVQRGKVRRATLLVLGEVAERLQGAASCQPTSDDPLYANDRSSVNSQAAAAAAAATEAPAVEAAAAAAQEAGPVPEQPSGAAALLVQAITHAALTVASGPAK